MSAIMESNSINCKDIHTANAMAVAAFFNQSGSGNASGLMSAIPFSCFTQALLQLIRRRPAQFSAQLFIIDAQRTEQSINPLRASQCCSHGAQQGERKIKCPAIATQCPGNLFHQYRRRNIIAIADQISLSGGS